MLRWHVPSLIILKHVNRIEKKYENKIFSILNASLPKAKNILQFYSLLLGASWVRLVMSLLEMFVL